MNNLEMGQIRGLDVDKMHMSSEPWKVRNDVRIYSCYGNNNDRVIEYGELVRNPQNILDGCGDDFAHFDASDNVKAGKLLGSTGPKVDMQVLDNGQGVLHADGDLIVTSIDPQKKGKKPQTVLLKRGDQLDIYDGEIYSVAIGSYKKPIAIIWGTNHQQERERMTKEKVRLNLYAMRSGDPWRGGQDPYNSWQ